MIFLYTPFRTGERWAGTVPFSHLAAFNLVHFTLCTYHFQLVLVVESMADIPHSLKDMWIIPARGERSPLIKYGGYNVPMS